MKCLIAIFFCLFNEENQRLSGRPNQQFYDLSLLLLMLLNDSLDCGMCLVLSSLWWETTQWHERLLGQETRCSAFSADSVSNQLSGLHQVTSFTWAPPPSSLTWETCRWSLPVAIFKSNMLKFTAALQRPYEMSLKGNNSEKTRKLLTCKGYFLLALKSDVFYRNVLY